MAKLTSILSKTRHSHEWCIQQRTTLASSNFMKWSTSSSLRKAFTCSNSLEAYFFFAKGWNIQLTLSYIYPSTHLLCASTLQDAGRLTATWDLRPPQALAKYLPHALSKNNKIRVPKKLPHQGPKQSWYATNLPSLFWPWQKSSLIVEKILYLCMRVKWLQIIKLT